MRIKKLKMSPGLVERMEGSRAEIVMFSVRMKRSEKNRIHVICAENQISAQALVFTALEEYFQRHKIVGFEGAVGEWTKLKGD